MGQAQAETTGLRKARDMSFYWRMLALLGVIVAALDLVLFAGFRTPHWAFDVLLWLAAGFVTLWWVSRAGLVWRHNQRCQLEPIGNRGHTDDEFIALPSQQHAIAALSNLLMPSHVRDGRIISLKGAWGVGKTTILLQLRDRLEREGCFAPVWINVWRTETETELHMAFYEDMLHTPAVFRECWLALPWLLPRLSFLLRRMVRSVRLAFKNGNLEAEATFQAEVPLALTVQPQIEWIANRMRRAGVGVVVILEELDRATPIVTKHAIAATERSFKLPGVTVILPYVPDHLWNKVFNPLDPAPADLDSSMETLLHREVMQMADRPPYKGRLDEVEVPPPEYLGLYAANPIPQAKEAGSPRPLDPRAPLAVWWRYRLHRFFAVVLDEQDRKRLFRRFSEKYLGGYQVELQGYGSRDLAALVTEKGSLFRMAQRAFPALAIADPLDAKQVVREAFERYHPNVNVLRLRHFEHFYLRLLEMDLHSLAGPGAAATGAEQEKLQALIKTLDERDDFPDDARDLLEKLEELSGIHSEDWSLRYAARALTAVVALAAWYTQMFMEGAPTA